MLLAGFLFLLLMLYVGSRFGGIGLGAVSGVGLLVEVFVFRFPPTSPPITVMLIIVAVVVSASVLEAAGGMLWLLQIAERWLRKHPNQITFFGPLVTYFMTMMLGTGHSVYTVMPIIGDVALKNNIRPERPMAVASVASQLAITASPISAAVVYSLGALGAIDSSISLLTIVGITIPATLLGTLLMSLWSVRRGKDLKDDPEFQENMKDSTFRKEIEEHSASVLNKTLPSSAKPALIIFLLAIVSIVVLGMMKQCLIIGDAKKPLEMSLVIQMVMLATAGITLMITRIPVDKVKDAVVFKSGFIAVIAIFGIAWMSDTYFHEALPVIKPQLTSMVENAPWTFALAMFIVSVMINSQAAVVIMMFPIAIGLGLPPALLIALLPASYGYFFIPNYPSDIATVNFDITKTTKIGKYYFNHSFMMPGIIGVVAAVVIGYFISKIVM